MEIDDTEKPCDYYEQNGCCPVLMELELLFPAQCQQPLSDDEIGM